MRRIAAFSFFFLFFCFPAVAHEVRPAYLEIRENAPETYDVVWKVPGRGENLRLGIYVRFPLICTETAPRRAGWSHQALVESWQIHCPGGLAGQRVAVDGLQATFTDVLVRFERLDGTQQTARMTPSEPAFLVESAPNQFQIIKTYLILGVEHILLGWDHLLFVFALILLVKDAWRVIKTVTAFTVSHSLTLSLAALGFVHVPSSPVEAVIALSIVFVALEIVRKQQGYAGLTVRFPWLVAFIFGLMHGLGFAGALSEIGLPQKFIPEALLFFSIGVELGHFAFVGAVVLVFAWLKRLKANWPDWLEKVPPYMVGGTAAYWLIERVSGF